MRARWQIRTCWLRLGTGRESEGHCEPAIFFAPAPPGECQKEAVGLNLLPAGRAGVQEERSLWPLLTDPGYRLPVLQRTGDQVVLALVQRTRIRDQVIGTADSRATILAPVFAAV